MKHRLGSFLLHMGEDYFTNAVHHSAEGRFSFSVGPK